MHDVIVAVGQAFAVILATAVPVLVIGSWLGRDASAPDGSKLLPRAVVRRRA